MAEPIIAAPSKARNNSVLELVHTFKSVLEYVTDKATSCEAKNNCLQALETLIDVGYKAVKECGINSKLETYQKHFHSYIYHSSVYFGKQSQTPMELDDHALQMAQSLVDMLLLVEDSFMQLGYPGYYQDFARAVKMSLKGVGGGSDAGLLRDAARLVNSCTDDK